jgi:hypothetical protein
MGFKNAVAIGARWTAMRDGLGILDRIGQFLSGEAAQVYTAFLLPGSVLQ